MRAARLSQVAYDHVKHMLLDGGVPAAGWLPIDEIAAALGASRQPVMDAMKRLVLEGFIEIVPQVGCRVVHPEQREVEDFFRFFAAGEALIAELAAARARPVDVLSLKLISGQIGELLRLTADVTEQARSYRVLNRRLHAEMRRISRSRTTANVVERLGDLSDFYVGLTNRALFGLNLHQAHREHEEIVAAIGRGDCAGARAAMERHIGGTGRLLAEANAVAENAA